MNFYKETQLKLRSKLSLKLYYTIYIGAALR